MSAMVKSVETTEMTEQRQAPPGLGLSKYSRRVILSTILNREDGGVGLVGERVVVGGWVKSYKGIHRQQDHVQSKLLPPVPSPTPSSNVVDLSCSEVLMSRVPLIRSITRLFLNQHHSRVIDLPTPSSLPPASPSSVYLWINDGSCTLQLQIVLDSSVHLALSQVMQIGTSILVQGTITKAPDRSKFAVQIVVEKVVYIGMVESNKNRPTQNPTRFSSAFLRLNSHLRPKSTTVESTSRIRNGLTQGTHAFFQKTGFIHIHTPVITSTRTGSGTTCINTSKHLRVKPEETAAEKAEKKKVRGRGNKIGVDAVKVAIKEKSRRIEELRRSDSNRDAIDSAIEDLKNAKNLAMELEQKKHNSLYLSMSAGLHLENYGCGLSSVYSLGPVFQAAPITGHNSQKKTADLSEMWVVEVNLAFSELEDGMKCSEDYLKFLCGWVLENCSEDVKFSMKKIDRTCFDRIRLVQLSSFKQITYTEAVETLNKVESKTFKQKVEWGLVLSEEQQRYLCDEMYKQPVIIYNHPKNLKPFFLRLNDDNNTVASFDIIIPKVGLLISGGQREERTDVINLRIDEAGLQRKEYEWYIDLRRQGKAKQTGFSVVLENLAMFVVGTDDVRDVIPIPTLLTHGI